MLAIARAAFLREGYAAASVAEIAAKIGGSKATLYSYFPSKKDLFVAVIEDEVRRMFVPLFDMDETQGAFRKVLEGFGRRFLDLLLAEDSVAFYRLVVAESARFPEVGQAAYQFGVQHGLDHLAGFFAAAMERGELRRAEASVAVTQFLDLCSGELHRNAVTTFLAAYGADEVSRAARA
jgi:AcrR family transcriptional regulator